MQPTHAECTPGSGEGVLPTDDEVIPDTSTLYSHSREMNILDLYSVGDPERTRRSVPFVHGIQLKGPKGEIVRMRSVFDDGAMVNTIDCGVFTQVENHLSPLQKSSRTLRMADGRLVPSLGIWRGDVVVATVCHGGAFEVFDSGGAWALLFGKPLLETFKATHDYSTDTIRLPHNEGWVSVANEFLPVGCLERMLVGLTTDIKQRESLKGGCAPPSRQVSYLSQITPLEQIDESPFAIDHDQLPVRGQSRRTGQWSRCSTMDQYRLTCTNSVGDLRSPLKKVPPLLQTISAVIHSNKLPDPPVANQTLAGIETIQGEHDDPENPTHANLVGDLQSPLREVPTSLPVLPEAKGIDINLPSPNPHLLQGAEVVMIPGDRQDTIWTVDTGVGPAGVDPGAEQPKVPKPREPSILTRKTFPFKPERVEVILEEITIGPDLSDLERSRVTLLLREFADCFALSMGEVLPVEGAAHKLNVPEGATFSTKINQRPLTAPQRDYFNSILDKMLEADIVEPIAHRDVKCCGATTLAKKQHDGGGLTIEELQHRLNDECVAAGLPSAFKDLPPRDAAGDTAAVPQNKWRVCQNFAALNKVTQVPPMPQGDIRAKQQRLSGHRWVNVFDFASGFYACEITIEDRPYICFYVEGRGYFCYKRMPFGLTGAPSTFAEMTARALGDLIGTLFELFVDDGGLAGDDFDATMGNLRILFTRVRSTGLSLSASKSSFFMTEAVFAGARVGPQGVRPDLTKLTAIVDWKRPADLQNLNAFTGLTGYFRPLIKGYAAIAQPLTDLARAVDMPRDKGKGAYRRAMKGHSLVELWKPEHDKAFLHLKVALTSEPVLKGPKFDGTPFIITSDGCKFGLAGMCSQRHTTVGPNGKAVTRIHPVAFASKRTSVTEEKYKPFLLKFAALKFSLDKFADIIWGFPVELETDCQALCDHLLNNKLPHMHGGVMVFWIIT